MEVLAHNFYSIFQAACSPSKLIKIHNIETPSADEFIIHGEFVTKKGRGHMFEVPCTPEMYKNLVIAIADTASDKLKAQKAAAKNAREAKEPEEPVDRPLKMKPLSFAPPPSPPAPAVTPVKKEAPSSLRTSFAPPKSMCPVKPVRQRLSSEASALLKKFETLQPMKNKKRRTEEELAEIEVARSYLLADQTQIVLDWIKYFQEVKKAS